MNADIAARETKPHLLADATSCGTVRDDTRFAWLTTALFLIVAGLTIFRHEVWRDEVQAWMIASDSTSLSNLFHNLRYDGHPALWYLLLYPIGRFTHDPAAMQALHVLLAAGAVFIMLRYSPLSRLQKVLIAFGYFPFYEYAVVSRNYALGMLLIFAFCALFARRQRNLLPISVVLLLLANASAYGWMTAIALSMTLAAAWIVDRRSGRPWGVPAWSALLSVGIILVGIAVSYLVMKPCPDAGQYVEWHTSFEPLRFVRALASIGSAHMLMPTIINQWATFSNGLRIELILAALGGLILAYQFCLFARRPVVLFAYVSASLTYLALIYAKHPGTLRHHGHFVLVFVACLWLSALYGDERLRWRPADRISSACNRAGVVLIPAFLCIQFAGGLVAAGRDVVMPFSMGKAAAEFIDSHGLSDMPILGDRDTPTSTVAAYLDRPIYYPANGGLHTFVVFDRARKWKLSDEELAAGIEQWISRNHRDVLVVLNYEPDWAQDADLRLRKIAGFTGSIVDDEEYWLYIAERTPSVD